MTSPSRIALIKWITGGGALLALGTLMLWVAGMYISKVEDLATAVDDNRNSLSQLKHTVDADQAQWRVLREQEQTLDSIQTEIAIMSRMAKESDRKFIIQVQGLDKFNQQMGAIPPWVYPPRPELGPSKEEKEHEALRKELKKLEAQRKETDDDFKRRVIQQQSYDNVAPQQTIKK